MIQRGLEFGNAPDYEILAGDCRDVMAAMDAESVDSIVSDPPYGLSQASKRNVRSLSSAMLEVILPDLANLYAKRFGKAELPFPRDSVLFLDWALRSVGVETRVGVPKGAVDLKDDAIIRQEEIEATGISPVGVPDGMLMDEVDPSLDKLLGEYVLSFRPLRHSAFSDCERIGLRQLGPSRFSVPVVVPADSDFACFLLAKPHGGATSFANFVGIEDDALAESQGSSSVVTDAATELVVVLAFDMATGTCEVLPASGAGQVDLIAELVSTKRVTASTATSGLPAVFKPHRIRLVGGAADGALTVNFHREFLSCLNSSRGGFMSQAWDHGVPGVEFWTEALRVAKPGAHLLAFGGTRTYHRIACAIEDAGWEIRDCVMWVYGSGFPKSHNVSVAIDKMDASEEQERRRLRFTAWVRGTGATSRQIDEATGTNMGAHYTTAASQPRIMTREHLEQCRHLLGDVPEWVEREADIRSVESRNFAEREVLGQSAHKPGIANGTKGHRTVGGTFASHVDITAPATPEAKQWSGWGTSLKPSYEPVIVARKPLIGTVAQNVLTHGTGGINIDGCRVGTETIQTTGHKGDKYAAFRGGKLGESFTAEHVGRWPANLIHDGSDEVVGLFPNVKTGNVKPYVSKSNGFLQGCKGKRTGIHQGDSGSAARFFYVAKCSRKDRNEGLEGVVNHHPCLKPTALMRYLCRLVTPPGGIVLDPFMGSGSTGKAAMLEGFRFIGIEREAEYVEIARARIGAVLS